jgi:hypothetical protein
VSRSAEQAVIQSEKMAANEVHARQETFLRISQSVRNQLGTIMGFLYISSQAANWDGSVSPEEQSRLFSQLSLGDSEIFSRRMLETYVRTTDAGGSASFGLVEPGTRLVTVRLADGRSALFPSAVRPGDTELLLEMP